MKKFQSLCILSLLILMTGCATGRSIVRLACPKPPILLKVEVKNKSITGKDVDRAIENNQRLWEHIHILHKLGCKDR